MPWGVDTVFASPMLGATQNRAVLESSQKPNYNRTTTTPSLVGSTGGGFQSPTSLGGGATPEAIIQLVNEINQTSQQTANAGRIPGGADLENLSSANISSALSGQLDPSVLQQLGQQSAERGIMTGSPGGPSTNAQYLRSLGLTSLDLMGQGQNWLTQATARNPAAPIYNAGNMVITPEQRLNKTFQDRFWYRVHKTESCWNWTGGKLPAGYGRMSRGKREDSSISAHLVSWIIHNGIIPEGLCVLHKCDNRGCVNPDHLFLGTNADNSRDMVSKGRSCFGEKNGFSRLTAEIVLKVRELNRLNESQHSLSRKFGISLSQIHRIVHRRTWKHI